MLVFSAIILSLNLLTIGILLRVAWEIFELWRENRAALTSHPQYNTEAQPTRYSDGSYSREYEEHPTPSAPDKAPVRNALVDSATRISLETAARWAGDANHSVTDKAGEGKCGE